MKNFLQLIFVIFPYFFFSQVKHEKITLEHTNVTQTTNYTDGRASQSVNYTTIQFSTPSHKPESIGKFGVNLEPYMKLDPEAYKEFQNYQNEGKKMQRSAWLSTVGYALIAAGILVFVLSNNAADKQALANGQDGHGVTGGMVAGGVIGVAGIATAIIPRRAMKKHMEAASTSFYRSIEIYNSNLGLEKNLKK